MSVLSDLTLWYTAQCNGEWEHRHGISVESTDNPGWWVKVDIRETPLHGRAFAPVEDGVDGDGFQTGPSWISCRIKDDVWHGAGDQTRLEEILSRFIAWARLEG